MNKPFALQNSTPGFKQSGVLFFITDFILLLLLVFLRIFVYTACSGTEIENLSAGNYFVRYAEDHNHFASSDAEVTVGEGASLADFTITFDRNGGSGNMDSVTVKAGTNYILLACGFTAPTDQQFKAWEISGTEYKVGDSYTVLGDTEIKALWENSVITPTTYTVTVRNDGYGTGRNSFHRCGRYDDHPDRNAQQGLPL